MEPLRLFHPLQYISSCPVAGSLRTDLKASPEPVPRLQRRLASCGPGPWSQSFPPRMLPRNVGRPGVPWSAPRSLPNGSAATRWYAWSRWPENCRRGHILQRLARSRGSVLSACAGTFTPSWLVSSLVRERRNRACIQIDRHCDRRSSAPSSAGPHAGVRRETLPRGILPVLKIPRSSLSRKVLHDRVAE